MKNGILRLAITLLLLTFMVAIFPTERDYQIYEDTLRLHILANSDSREDQDAKIGVRDLILDKFGGELEGAEAISSALMITESMLTDIVILAEDFLKNAGIDYGVEASIKKEWYETRDYGNFTLPRGYYSSLVITLGAGEGQNWWCIMFPPMCRNLASEDSKDDPSNDNAVYDLGGEKYTIKFKTLEIIADLFKKKG